MTVAAVILADEPEIVRREIHGVPNVRRLVDVAWAGGAVPIVVVAPDPDGGVGAALAGAEVTQAEPAPEGAGPVGQVCRGIDVAVALVAGTEGALVWPARMGWVDAETVTSLIEAHGTDRACLLRASFRGEAGWPALVPVAHLEALRGLGRDRAPDALLAELAALVPSRLVELGDPGVTHPLDTPREALPPFEGPSEPASGRAYEWGATIAERADDAALQAPGAVPHRAPEG